MLSAISVVVLAPTAAAAAAAREAAEATAWEAALEVMSLPAKRVLLPLLLLVHRIRIVHVLSRIVSSPHVIVAQHLVCARHLRSNGKRTLGRVRSQCVQLTKLQTARQYRLLRPNGARTFLNISSAAFLSSSLSTLSGWYCFASLWYAFLMSRLLALRGTPSTL